MIFPNIISNETRECTVFFQHLLLYKLFTTN